MQGYNNLVSLQLFLSDNLLKVFRINIDDSLSSYTLCLSSRRQLNIIWDNYGHNAPVTATGNDEQQFLESIVYYSFAFLFADYG